jgi:hypothetical protein
MVDKITKGYMVTLAKPMIFSYPETTYVGEWFEEKWFIKANSKKENTLHYKLFQTEELTTLVHSLKSTQQRIKEKQIIEVNLGLYDGRHENLIVAVRGS